MKDLLPLIGFAIAVIAILLIVKLNKESRKIREEAFADKKKKKRQELELFDALKDFIPQQSLMIIFHLIHIDKNVNVKAVQLGHELKVLKEQDDKLELKDIDDLKEEIHFFILKDIGKIDETLDVFLEKVRKIKEEKGIDDADDFALIE